MKQAVKQYRFLTRVLALALCLMLPFSQAQAAMKENEAREKAYAIIKERTGMGPEDMKKVEALRDSFDNSWFFVFRLKNPSPTSDANIAIAFNLDGSLNSFHYEEVSHQTLMSQLVYDQNPRLTTEDIYRVQQNWREALPILLEQPYIKRAVERKDHVSGYIHLLQQEIILPEADMLEMARAEEIARQAVLALPGWTQEKLDMYPLHLDLFYQSQEYGKTVVLLAFHQKSSWNYTEWNDYIKQYINPLEALFAPEYPPEYISLKLDAYSGELLEAPFLCESQKSGRFVDLFWQVN